MKNLGLILFPLLAVGVSSCASGGGEMTCSSDRDCDGLRCIDARCVAGPMVDSGLGGGDASVEDAGRPGFDAGARDAGPGLPDAGTADAGAPDAWTPPACTAPGDCSDSNMCTTDECVAGECAFTPVACDDADACTVDVCDPSTGCASAALSCDDADACTTDGCDPSTGCSNVPVTVPGGTCAAPIDVSRGGTFSGDSSCAASDFAGVCGGSSGPDTAFVFDLSEESMVRLDASGSSFAPALFVGSSCGDASRGCEGSGSGVLAVTLPAGRYYAGLDGRLGGDAGAWSLGVTITPVVREEVLTFPSSGDTRFYALGDRYWNAGDYVQGSRSTSLTSIRSADLTLSVSPNGLTCDNQDMQLRINGTVVGAVPITPGSSTITRSFTFAPITGPTYTLRLETIRTVNSGCGSAGLPDGVSTLRVGG